MAWLVLEMKAKAQGEIVDLVGVKAKTTVSLSAGRADVPVGALLLWLVLTIVPGLWPFFWDWDSAQSLKRWDSNR